MKWRIMKIMWVKSIMKRKSIMNNEEWWIMKWNNEIMKKCEIIIK